MLPADFLQAKPVAKVAEGGSRCSFAFLCSTAQSHSTHPRPPCTVPTLEHLPAATSTPYSLCLPSRVPTCNLCLDTHWLLAWDSSSSMICLILGLGWQPGLPELPSLSKAVMWHHDLWLHHQVTEIPAPIAVYPEDSPYLWCIFGSFSDPHRRKT